MSLSMSPKEATEIHKVTIQPWFLQSRQNKSPQPLLTGCDFQPRLQGSSARCIPNLHNPLTSALQPVLHSVHHEPAHPTAGQSGQRDAVRDSIKSLTKNQENYIQCLSFSHGAVTLSQEETRSVRRDLPFGSPCWLYNGLSIAASAISPCFIQVLSLDSQVCSALGSSLMSFL